MILTTTGLIVLIVAGFGALNMWNIGRVYDENRDEQARLIQEQLARVGAATVGTLASSSRTFLENSNAQDLKRYVKDLATKDPNVDFIYVADANGGLVAHSDEKKATEGNPPVDEASWKRVQEIWTGKKDKPAEQEPLIAAEPFEGTAGRELLFALPVFQAGVQPTVKGAMDRESLLGSVVIAYNLRSLDKAVASINEAREKAFRDTAIKTAGVGAFFVLIGALLAILQGLRIAKPIKMLAWRADQIARGDLETRVEVTSTDEIGLLGENFNYMADQLVVLLRQTAEKATLEKELEVARTIQETLVPTNETVDRKFVKLSGYFQPATTCGGDWWTHHELKDGKVLVVIGDVTGHGVPSAMITAAAKAACDVARAVNHDDVTCTQLLEIMNHAIYESAKRKFVMTCFASILDPKARTITYANAGHNFPYLYRQQGDKGEFGSLMTRGNRLGDLPDSKYTSKTMELIPGDVLIWYTDGIVECENDKGEEYGEKRFRASIRRVAHQEPAEMRDSVVNAAMQFFGERPRKDDLTMVFARVY